MAGDLVRWGWVGEEWGWVSWLGGVGLVRRGGRGELVRWGWGFVGWGVGQGWEWGCS